jgi:homogentisate 1,2-dioxygenase
VLDNGFPDGQADQQEDANDSDPDAGFRVTSVFANPAVDERPHEHHEDDESRTDYCERATEQFQPAERHVEPPLWFER